MDSHDSDDSMGSAEVTMFAAAAGPSTRGKGRPQQKGISKPKQIRKSSEENDNIKVILQQIYSEIIAMKSQLHDLNKDVSRLCDVMPTIRTTNTSKGLRSVRHFKPGNP